MFCNCIQETNFENRCPIVSEAIRVSELEYFRKMKFGIFYKQSKSGKKFLKRDGFIVSS
ncbi:hypothetical protein LEP1GSC043_0397 [Leptospira weilii str. Ecochallenge]|uniref:Uncharacterized protein n=1 Tax=Leptospira weilii str. Ecochallenge TaxID=1049986 RepID=N1U5B4_9LEPT|nr:hypothetical protein LEP1GSC043_0397 [Leptospira weilii str. Ecochallenge]